MATALPFYTTTKPYPMPSIKSAVLFAWEEFNKEPFKYIAFTAISLGVPLVLGYISTLAKFLSIIVFIITPPLQTGTSAYFHHKAETGKSDFNFFFNPYYKTLQLCWFQVLAILGFIIITLPLTTWSVIVSNNNGAEMSISEMGWPIQVFCFITLLVVVYFAICLMFVPYYIYFYKQPVQLAIKNSFGIVQARWFWFFGLYLCLAAIMLAGFLCFVIGVAVAIPIARLTSYYVFAQYTGLDAKRLDAAKQM
jgi:hypothetical protein